MADTVTLTIDGQPVTVEKGKTVLQAAIEAGISVPYYCYHPGLTVDGSCRVCVVKIEKMPKLQTSCSTTCTDGMVVSTRDAETTAARAGVLEFLLVNHPLDCPVCDKGGECPLQDISFGWGSGRSRFIEPKRHFKKPLELSPSHCNVKFTIRDDARVVRVLARDNEAVDDGWLCDKGRFGYQVIHSKDRLTAPMVRDGGALREVSWERALGDATAALRRAGERSAALVGGQATNEEGLLVQHLMRGALGSSHVDSRFGGGIDGVQARVLARPDLSAAVADIDHAGAILVLETELVDEAPILDLRVRKAVRRNGARLVVASSRPSTLDPNATASLRFAPGAAEAAIAALATALEA